MAAGLYSLFSVEGMLIDLNTVPTLDLTNPWWNQNANEEYTLYGKHSSRISCTFR